MLTHEDTIVVNDTDDKYGVDKYEVILEPSEEPQKRSTIRKWLAVVIISSAGFCVTCSSSIASSTETNIEREFHVSHEVSVLSVSMFVLGLGFGPLLVGPLSEVYGRNIIYQVSFFVMCIFSFPLAFTSSIAVYLIFRFLTGFAGAAFMSVAGGSVADLFSDKNVANPMALYTLSPFIGPVLGPLIGGFINQHVSWRWTWRVQIIWVFVELVGLILLVPETYIPVLLQRKARRLRKSTGDPQYRAPLDKEDHNLLQSIVISCYKPFELMLYDRMALLLNTWTALILGILYLTFQAFPIVFGKGHGFSLQYVGLSFLCIGLGMLIGLSTQPFWNRVFQREAAKHGGKAPPEARLLMGQVGGILVPFSLFMIAFTTYPHVHWIAPMICSIPFGTGIYFVFTAVFTYLVTAYRPIAASAMASNSALRSSFAAGFSLLAGPMYAKLGTVGATALLAGLTTIMAPLPFIFHKIGPSLRAKSRFAVA